MNAIAHTIVGAYLDTWNATDPQTRAALLADHWAPDATYTDPLADVAGPDEIGALVGGVHEQFPGFVFSLVGEPDAHHRHVRFQWALGPAGAEPPVVGFDVITVDDADRITSVAGFLDRVPA
ncbi:nuclear transport factor 2 family protein [Tsukamurella sp. 8F]|uniref:nuclear transport factor 2 family protein n=1 Tax=unclassified Tsukamurella TaxID=2633480 RepID=UPI0023B9D0B0|nr:MULTISPECIES: nuclear transport factor 2 family protein [unclassified Tsukamurella]MDF0530607.1 nuclear transport factor 2 family protein [Tsukamurella sp. 8J]MDF0587808.1 nuclear transport factor 2 family protein [Tsukamurella sp. 8F]